MATPTNLPPTYTQGQTNTAALMNSLRGAFRILQVVHGTTSTVATSASTTWVPSLLTVTITPQSSSSKILVYAQQNIYADAANGEVGWRLKRDSTVLQTNRACVFSSAGAIVGDKNVLFLDSPATTSAVIYSTDIRREAGGGTIYAQINTNPGNIVVCEVSA